MPRQRSHLLRAAYAYLLALPHWWRLPLTSLFYPPLDGLLGRTRLRSPIAAGILGFDNTTDA